MKPSPKTKRVTKLSTKKSISDDFGVRAGQPTKYRQEYCEQLILHARKGKTFEEFANNLDVHTDTLQEWKAKHKEFSVAWRRAKELSELYMVKLGMKSMHGKPIAHDIVIYETIDSRGKVKKKKREVPRFLNQTMWKYFMACRFGWRDEGDFQGDPEDDDLELDFD